METIIQVAGMTEAVCALLLMAFLGIAGTFITKKDIENLDKPATPETK